MDGAALQLFGALRGADWGDGSDGIAVEPLEAFACLVLGRPPGALNDETRDVVRRAAAAAKPAERFRLVYAALAGGASAGDSRRRSRTPALALESLPYLRHQQRAALGLRCVLGFRDEEVAHVLGLTPREAAIVVEAGIANVRRREGVAVEPPAAEPPAATAQEADQADRVA